jgi:phospholipid transport system substrate-binding protein
VTPAADTSPTTRGEKRRFCVLPALLLAVLVSALAAGQTADTLAPIPRDDPEVMLREATNRLLQVAREARAYAGDDPERYYSAVHDVLDGVLDIHYFARGVMATYASARLYRSLQTEAERQAFRDRLERFVEAIKRVFMVKYADVLLTFEGERIDLASLPTGSDDPDRASMQQTIYDSNGETYLVQYSLHRVEEGGWKVYNVIVEGINLGQIYRNQFSEAVENHRGDVDYVVDHWVELMMARDAAERAAGENGK